MSFIGGSMSRLGSVIVMALVWSAVARAQDAATQQLLADADVLRRRVDGGRAYPGGQGVVVLDGDIAGAGRADLVVAVRHDGEDRRFGQDALV